MNEPKSPDPPVRESPGPAAPGDALGPAGTWVRTSSRYTAHPRLIDERSDPDFRTLWVAAAASARRIDVAIGGLRLTGLDLSPREIAGVRRVRLLLAELNGLTLRAEAEALHTRPDRARRLRHLVDRLEAGSVEVRAAPLGGWTPDFSVFHDRFGARSALLGLHWFERPFPHRGPALAVEVEGAGAQRAAAGFERAWAAGHDLSEAVVELMRRAERRSGVNPETESPAASGEQPPRKMAAGGGVSSVPPP